MLRPALRTALCMSIAPEAGRLDQGIRLTLAGLKQPNNVADEAAACANLCAGYAGLRRWRKALPHCDRSLGLDANNWRALTDVAAALKIAPDSPILQKSLQVIIQHRKAAATLDRRKKPAKA